MKKVYTTPTAEKVVFDYAESVVACPSGCRDPRHPWHSGVAYPACDPSKKGGGAQPPVQETAKPQSGGNSYWGQAWGAVC